MNFCFPGNTIELHNNVRHFRLTKKKKILLAAVHAVLAVVILVTVILVLKNASKPNAHRAAIVTNGLECARIARFVPQGIDHCLPIPEYLYLYFLEKC